MNTQSYIAQLNINQYSQTIESFICGLEIDAWRKREED